MTSAALPPASPPPTPSPVAATNAAPVLEARSLFRFRTVDGQQLPIVRDVTFTLRQGEFATIMGPSGSGKWTLLHMLAGLDRPSAGQVLLSGVDLGSGDEEFRAGMRRERLGFVFQFFNLLGDSHLYSAGGKRAVAWRGVNGQCQATDWDAATGAGSVEVTLSPPSCGGSMFQVVEMFANGVCMGDPFASVRVEAWCGPSLCAGNACPPNN